MYSKAKGWTENDANYTTDFYDVFVKGVAARWNRILTYAEGLDTLIEAGNGYFSDDEKMVIFDANYVGFSNKFFNQDIRYLSHTSQEWPLLHKNGTATTKIVPSVRIASAGVLSMVNSYDRALKTTVTRFLKTFGVRIDKDIFGYNAIDVMCVEWASSQTAPIGSVPGTKVPLLTMGNTFKTAFDYMDACMSESGRLIDA